MNQTLHIGTPGDQALHALATKLRTEGILIAEPWDDGESGGTAWWRLVRGLRTEDIGQCGYIEDRRRYEAPHLAENSRVRWSGGGIRIRRKKFPTREAAMAYVDSHLHAAGWVLP